MKIDQIKTKLTELREATKAIIERSEAEQRDLSDNELKEVSDLNGEFEGFKLQLEARQKIDAQDQYMSASAGRQTTPEQPDTRSNQAETGNQKVTDGGFRNDDKKQWGWRNAGEQLVAIIKACNPEKRNQPIDQRLQTRSDPTTFGSESVGEDGGFAMAPSFASEIMKTVASEDSLLARTSTVTPDGNSFAQPVDDGEPWSTSSGVQAYWEGEARQYTQSNPNLKTNAVKANKLTALVGVTEELLEDASGMASYINIKAPEVMSFKTNLALIQGSGVGQPLGILNSGATVSVAKVGSQVADTLVAQNVIDMWARLYAPNRSNAVWLINQDVEPMLDTMSIQGKLNTGAVSADYGSLVYLPANGLAGAGFATLKGRPVIPTQACETIGDVGDIILADLSAYMTVRKTAGIQASTSIHLWFDWDVMAFKFRWRLGGRPWRSAPITPRVGSATLSPFVTLAARA